MAPELRLNAAGELPADVVNKHVSGKILIMEGAEKYDIYTLMCDKKVFLTHKDMEELLAVEMKIQRVRRLRGLGQVHATHCFFASIIMQNMKTFLNFS